MATLSNSFIIIHDLCSSFSIVLSREQNHNLACSGINLCKSLQSCSAAGLGSKLNQLSQRINVNSFEIQPAADTGKGWKRFKEETIKLGVPGSTWTKIMEGRVERYK